MTYELRQKILALFWLTNPTRGVQNVLLAFGICLTRVAARLRMLAHKHDAVTQGEVLIGILPHGLIECGMRQDIDPEAAIAQRMCRACRSHSSMRKLILAMSCRFGFSSSRSNLSTRS